MTAAPDFGFPEDDWMDIADAVGVSRHPHPDNLLNYRPHPCYRAEFSNYALRRLLDEWSAQVGDVATNKPDCGTCGGAGAIATPSPFSPSASVPCPECRSWL